MVYHRTVQNGSRYEPLIRAATEKGKKIKREK